MMESLLSIVLEFARTDAPEDPYEFSFKPQEYSLRTKDGGRKRVRFEWSDGFLDHLGQLREENCDPAVIQRVAHTLRNFLEPVGWSYQTRDIVDAVQSSRPVIVTIRSAAAELYALPWELLSLEGSGQCIGALPGVLVRYEWPQTRTTPPRPGADVRGTRMLVAWSEAAGAVPWKQHVEAIAAACRKSACEFDPDPKAGDRYIVANASLGRLVDALDRADQGGRPVSVLHLLCHGGQAGQTTGLVLNDEDQKGKAVVVDPWRLRQFLAPHAATLRLVVVCACESASAGRFDSVAQAIHRTGFQTVVASRFLLSVSGSIRIAETLYDSMLVQRTSLQQAFLRTRTRLARNPSRLDWASLQLYAREDDGDETSLAGPSISTGVPVAVPHHGEATGPVGRPARAGTPPPVAAPTGSGGRAATPPPVDVAALELADLIELRQQLRGELSSRFEHNLALVFTDIVESTALFKRLGPQAALALQERYRELLDQVSTPESGRIFASTGDGLQACFPEVKHAIKACFAFFESVTKYNYEASREDQLIVRACIHYAPLLTDGDLIIGDDVDVAAEIVNSAERGQIRMSRQAFGQASKVIRLLCRPLPSLETGISDRGRVDLYELPWRNEASLPALVVNESTGEEIALPPLDTISFGRIGRLADGSSANDVVLDHPDDGVKRAISRWHFELRRVAKGYRLRQVSGQATEVDGKSVAQGDEVPVRPGTEVSIANALTLRFGSPAQDDIISETTLGHDPDS